MSLEYTGIPYFPLTSNFFEEDVPELLEAKFGIKASYLLIRLLSKIYKEGYYITWGEEQCIIFLRKVGGEVSKEGMNRIIDLLLEKGFFDKQSYQEHRILTSASIQKIWLEATFRRKRDLSKMPYLLESVIKDKQKKSKQKTDTNEEIADNLPVQGELKLQNASNSGQSKLEENKPEQTKQEEKKASSSKEEECEEGGKNDTSFCIPGYAYNTATHNIQGLIECLKSHKVSNLKEMQSILRLSDYGKKGTSVWKLLSNTNWNKIEAPGRYIIAALTAGRRKPAD